MAWGEFTDSGGGVPVNPGLGTITNEFSIRNAGSTMAIAFGGFVAPGSVVVPPPPTTTGLGGRKRQAFQLYLRIGRAELRVFIEPDLFGTLDARQPDPAAAAYVQAAALYALVETEDFGEFDARYVPSRAELLQAAELLALADTDFFFALDVRAHVKVALAPFVDRDEISAVAARRGLPPLAVLTWFLDRME
jgi:hypothetical protein